MREAVDRIARMMDGLGLGRRRRGAPLVRRRLGLRRRRRGLVRWYAGFRRHPRRLLLNADEPPVRGVELGPARRIGQDLVGLLDLAEVRRHPGRLALRPVEADETPVGVSDFLRRSVGAHSQDLIWVANRAGAV